MSSNYPPGSMMGSGIYSEKAVLSFTCSACGQDNNDAEGDTDDYKTEINVECMHCREEHTFPIEENE